MRHSYGISLVKTLNENVTKMAAILCQPWCINHNKTYNNTIACICYGIYCIDSDMCETGTEVTAHSWIRVGWAVGVWNSFKFFLHFQAAKQQKLFICWPSIAEKNNCMFYFKTVQLSRDGKAFKNRWCYIMKLMMRNKYFYIAALQMSCLVVKPNYCKVKLFKPINNWKCTGAYSALQILMPWC